MTQKWCWKVAALKLFSNPRSPLSATWPSLFQWHHFSPSFLFQNWCQNKCRNFELFPGTRNLRWPCIQGYSFCFRFDQKSHLNWTIAMSQHRIEYFDEGSSIPKIIFLFHLISLAFKSCFKSDQPTQQEKDQTNSRKAQYAYQNSKILATLKSLLHTVSLQIFCSLSFFSLFSLASFSTAVFLFL